MFETVIFKKYLHFTNGFTINNVNDVTDILDHLTNGHL